MHRCTSAIQTEIPLFTNTKIDSLSLMTTFYYHSVPNVDFFLTGNTGRVPLQLFNSRLKLRQQQQQKSDKMLITQKYDYFLVLDFEATCDDNKSFQPMVKGNFIFHIFNHTN